MNFSRLIKKGQREWFTTGMVSTIIGVTPRTIAKWCDSGQLLCKCIPGSQDRRIPRFDLLRFIKQHDCPVVRQDLIGMPTIGCLTTSKTQQKILDSIVKDDKNIRISFLSCQWELARRYEELSPIIVVFLDLQSIGVGPCHDIARGIQNEKPRPMLISVNTDDELADVNLFDVVVPYSASNSTIAKKTSELLNIALK